MALRSILSETQKIELLKAVQLDDAALFETLIEEYMSKANCNTTVQYVWNLLFQIKCGKDNLITIPFICCQLGSIEILKCLITLGQKHCSNSLKQFLCQINIPQSNTLIMTCIIPSNSSLGEERPVLKLKCLLFLLKQMKTGLNPQRLKKIINSINHHEMYVMVLAAKYNNFNAMKMIVEHTGHVLNTSFIISDTNDNVRTVTIQKTRETAVYFVKGNQEMEKLLINLGQASTNNMNKKKKARQELELDGKIFIGRYKYTLGDIKDIDIKIVSQLTFGALKCRRINKYFNRLITNDWNWRCLFTNIKCNP